MNDTQLCIIGGLVVACYGLYLGLYPNPQDGVILSAMVGALMLLAGKRWGEKKATDELIEEAGE